MNKGCEVKLGQNKRGVSVVHAFLCDMGHHSVDWPGCNKSVWYMNPSQTHINKEVELPYCSQQIFTFVCG